MNVPVSSTKSVIGHLLGAAGAVEAVAMLLALKAGVAPPTVGWEEREEGLDVDYVPGEAREMAEHTAERELAGVGAASGPGRRPRRPRRTGARGVLRRVRRRADGRGIAALDGYWKIFREQVFLSGRVPQIAVITGPAAGGAPTRPRSGTSW